MKLVPTLMLLLCFWGASHNLLGDTYTKWVPVAEIETSVLETKLDLEHFTEVYTLLPKQGNGQSIVMVPGHGLSHAIYLSTPDNRPSWAEFFADQGYAVYILNPGQNVASRSQPPQNASVSTWDVRRIWSRWGFGAEYPIPYDNGRFPTEYVDNFMNLVPLYTRQSSGGSQTEALLEVLEKTGPAHLIVHSAAGSAGFNLAKDFSDQLKSLIAIEPVGCPTEFRESPLVPFLAVYGDYIDARRQTSRYCACQSTVKNVDENRLSAAFIDYPASGVYGNTHLMMQDDNNLEIAADLLDWLESTQE